MSKMAQTIKDNFPLIEQYSGTVYTHEFVQDLSSAFEPLKDALARLDNKDKTTHDPPTKEDAVAVLRKIHADANLEQTIQDVFNAARPALVFSAHVMVIASLMHHPQDFAEKCERNASNQMFKDPSAKNMKNFILDTIVKKRRPIKRSLSVWDEGTDEDEDAEPAGRRRPRSRRRCDAEEDDDDNLRSLPRSVDTPVSRKRTNSAQKKSGSGRKRQTKDAFESDFSDLEETLSPKRKQSGKGNNTSATKKVASEKKKETEKGKKTPAKKARPQPAKPQEISDESSSSSESSYSSEDETETPKTKQATEVKQKKTPSKQNTDENQVPTETADKEQDPWKALEKVIAP